MRAAMQAVLWEVLYRNRGIFMTLAGLLAVALVAVLVPGRLDPAQNWMQTIEQLVVLTFLVSLLLAFTPFTFAESSGGWRMNSTLTRWFVLPMRTWPMVLLPLVAGGMFLAGLIAVWMPVLNRVAPGLDARYLTAVLIAGLAFLNALAWTVPRKPLQFWTGTGLLFPAMLILAFAPQDQPSTEAFRQKLLLPLGVATVMLTGYAWLAASRNRCGAWRGELPLDALYRLARGGAGLKETRAPRSAAITLFWTETAPGVRILGLSWLVLLLITYAWISVVLREARPDIAFSLRVLPLVGLGILPVLALVWMAVWGILGASDPNTMFRARLSSFRSTLPVSCGTLAGQRVLLLFLGWCVVWVPLVLMSYFYDPEITGIPAENRQFVQAAIGRLMVQSAFLAVGALPVLLLGRFEGFGSFLLAGVCSWAVCWAFVGQMRVLLEEPPGWRWTALSLYLGLKLVVAGWALLMGMRQGHITWRYPAVLTAGWVAVACFLIWVLPTWARGGSYDALLMVCLLPLARPALSPLAMAANRHR